jgi:glycosyltransferase involved in cell wall biosynthesis
VHFVQTGVPTGGVERYVAALLGGDTPGMEHFVVTHAAGPCPIAGRWPSASWPWLSAEVPPLPLATRAEAEDDVALFHGLPSREAWRRISGRGMASAVFCHDHEWWCPSAARYYARTSRICTITASTTSCALRYHALGCGSLRPTRTVEGFRRAAWGRSLLGTADAVFVASAFMLAEAVRHGAPAARSHLVPLPVAWHSDPSDADCTSAGTTDPDSDRRSPPIVLCASRLTPLKGIDELLRAFAAMRVPAKLVLAGAGNAAARLRRLTETHPARDRIIFAGHLDTDALRAAFARAAVVAVPSLWPEPFGLVGIEALAAGRPVVASGTGGMADWALKRLGVQTARPGDPAAFAAALDRSLSEPVWAERARRVGAPWVAERHGMAAHVRAMASALASRQVA